MLVPIFVHHNKHRPCLISHKMLLSHQLEITNTAPTVHFKMTVIELRAAADENNDHEYRYN